jgi:ribosomal-protein-alanine N-acetyltransferase
MFTPVHILPATWRDLPAIHALERACFGADAWGWLDLMGVVLGRNVLLKAQVDEQLVGFIAGEPHAADGYAWIITLGVLPNYQRRGIGAQLLAAAEARLSVPVLRLTVRASNQGAQALYQKMGYKSQYTVERYYVGGETGIVMEKYRSL